MIKRPSADKYHRKDQSRYTRRIPTGVAALDKALAGGLTKGLILLAATPGAGKTTLANQIADNIASRGEDVLFVSTEVTAKDLEDKFVSRRTFLRSERKWGLSVNQLDNETEIERMSQEIFDFQAKCADEMERELQTFSCVDNDSDNGTEVEWTVENIRKLIKTEWIDQGKHAPVVFIDYLQFLPSSTPDKQDFDIIKAQVKALKKMSTDFHIPVVLISALTRDSYNDPITLNSFKGSGSIEYTADIILALQYDGVGKKGWDYLKARSAFPRKMELQILKARRGDSSASILLDYYSAYEYFEETQASTEIIETPTNSRLITTGFGRTSNQLIIPGLSEPPVRTLRFFRNYPFLCFPTYLSFASNKRFLQRPYIVRFIIFNRLFVPSTKPLL